MHPVMIPQFTKFHVKKNQKIYSQEITGIEIIGKQQISQMVGFLMRTN
jgi:hypothetical protein